MLSGNFSQGTLILSFARFSRSNWYSAFVANPRSLNCLHAPGETENILKMRGTTTKQTTKSLLKRWYRQVFATLGTSYSSRHLVGLLRSSAPWCRAQDLLMSHVCPVCSHFNLCFPFSSSKIKQTKNPMSSSCMCWGQRCSRLNRTLQIEFTLDETNRFACVYPPETGWPAPGNEPSHLQTVQCAQLINGLLLEKCVRLWGEAMWSSRSQVQ